jgi:hypothetical protein
MKGNKAKAAPAAKGNRKPLTIQKPGSLRKSLGVKKGQKIPRSKLQAAAKKGGLLGQRARYALNVLIPASQRRAQKAKAKKTATRRK